MAASATAAATAPTGAPIAPGAATFPAVWTRFKLTPQQPHFLGGGDCDLLQEMHDLIVVNLELRDLDYQTSCVSGAVYPDSFQVRGEALKARIP